MKSGIRFTLLSALLITAVLTGCQSGDALITTNAASQTTAVSHPAKTTAPEQQPTEPEIVYHPEALWTPLSVNTNKGFWSTETENGSFNIGRYGTYDNQGKQIEIDPDQKIAIAASCMIGYPLKDQTMGWDGYPFSGYADLPEEIQAVITGELFDKYNMTGGVGNLVFLEDWLESQGFEVLKDHANHYSRINAEPAPDYHTYIPCVLIITTPRQLAEFKMPYPQADIKFWGAKYEEFAPEFMNFTG